MSRYQSAAPEGQPTHVPTIHIQGVTPGSPQHNAIVRAYSGALRQFHASQQQQVAISGQRQYSARKQVPGAKMHYHNNNGQETITMVVDAPITIEQEAEVLKEEFWEWALIELEWPFVAGDDIDVILAAFLHGKVKGSIVWAHDTYDENSPDNILRFADSQQEFEPLRDPTIKIMNPVDVVISPVGRSSLLVDLRKLAPSHVVSIDLYGVRDNSDGAFGMTFTNIQATLRAKLFKKRPVDAVSIQAGFGLDDALFYQWESSAIYPARLPLTVAPDKVTITDGFDSGLEGPEIFFGYPKIGAVKLGISNNNTGFRFVPA